MCGLDKADTPQTDEFKNFGREDLILLIECQKERIGELLADKDTPQTEDAYERGVKHAWEVAQKVFDSTVTFYEAEDVAKQIADTPQTDCYKCKDFWNCDGQCDEMPQIEDDTLRTDCGWK